MEGNATIRTNTRGPMVSGLAIGFTAAAVLVLSFRFYTRLLLLKNVGKDDWTVLAGSILSIIVTISTCYQVKYGMGRHSENVSAAEGIEQLKFLLTSVITYNIGMNVLKMSFLLQFRRIFCLKWVQRVTFWCMVYVGIWACVQAVLLGLSCLPISFIQPSTAGICLDTLPIWYFSSAMSMLLDIIIFCIPLPAVVKLQLPRQQKIMIFGIFSLGFFVCIISIYRMFTLKSAVESQDPSWENIGAAIWSSIELNISIICSCLPTLRPLIARILPGVGLSSARNDRSTYYRYGSTSTAVRTKDKKRQTQSISTEELALKEMTPSPSESLPAAYTQISADQSRQAWSNKQEIMVTTETSVEKR